MRREPGRRGGLPSEMNGLVRSRIHTPGGTSLNEKIQVGTVVTGMDLLLATVLLRDCDLLIARQCRIG